MISQEVWRIWFCLIAASLFVVAIAPVRAQNQDEQTEVPDLDIVDIILSCEEPIEENSVEIRVKIHNNCSVPVAHVSIILLIDRQEVGTMFVPLLDAYSTAEVSWNWTSERWSHIMGAVLVVGETPLADSTFEKEIYVQPKPLGDQGTLLKALGSILLVVLLFISVPGITSTLKEKSKRAKRRERA